MWFYQLDTSITELCGYFMSIGNIFLPYFCDSQARSNVYPGQIAQEIYCCDDYMVTNGAPN
jgi:hypothetical protein